MCWVPLIVAPICLTLILIILAVFIDNNYGEKAYLKKNCNRVNKIQCIDYANQYDIKGKMPYIVANDSDITNFLIRDRNFY